jgi:hypothetical protein
MTGRSAWLAVALPALSVVLLASGCVVGYKRRVSGSGSAVAADQLQTTHEGATTRDDITAAFGAPTQRFETQDGREILTYVYLRRVSTMFGFLIPLWSTSESEKIVRFNFELKDGLLQRYWTQEF